MVANKAGETVAIVGLGYVGLPLAVLAATKGRQVIGIDLDKAKVAAIKAGKSPNLDEFASKYLKPGLVDATTDFNKVSRAGIIIICVPTPVDEGLKPNLEPLKQAAKSVAQHMQKGSLVIVESTINPGVSDEIVAPLLEETSGLKAGRDFYLSHCPERINPGDTRWNIANIARVAGSYNPAGLERTVAFYESILDAPVKPMGSLKEAEAVKIVENTFRDVNIAFANELAMSFYKLGINTLNVIEGAATKPFAFMPHYPGVGVGGHCIPIDPYYLIENAKGYGFEHAFLTMARSINDKMPEFTAEVLKDGLAEIGLPLKDAQVAILGVAYKPDVDDDRESPAYKLIKLLQPQVKMLVIYDPYLPAKSTVKSLEEALQNSAAGIRPGRYRAG